MQNTIRIYGIIWVQCFPALQNKLKGNPDDSTISLRYDCLWLFKKIKMCTSVLDHTSDG